MCTTVMIGAAGLTRTHTHTETHRHILLSRPAKLEIMLLGLCFIYTLFRKNAVYSNIIHDYTKLKQYTNTHDKTKVRDKVTKNTFAE